MLEMWQSTVQIAVRQFCMCALCSSLLSPGVSLFHPVNRCEGDEGFASVFFLHGKMRDARCAIFKIPLTSSLAPIPRVSVVVRPA